MSDIFEQGINFQPLVDLGLKPEETKQVLAAVMPMVQLKLQLVVKEALGEEKMLELKKRADEQKKDLSGSLELIDAEYKEKTGEFLMERMRLLINEHLEQVAKIILQAREQEAKLDQLGTKSQIESLLKEDKVEEAAKLIEKGLGEV